MKTSFTVLLIGAASLFSVAAAQQGAGAARPSGVQQVRPEPFNTSSDGRVVSTDAFRVNGIMIDERYSVQSSSDDRAIRVQNVSPDRTIFPLSGSYPQSSDYTGLSTPDPRARGPIMASLDPYYSGLFVSNMTSGYYWAMNWDWTGFKHYIDSLSSAGFRLESVTSYGITTGSYAGTWIKDNKGWAYALNNTSAGLVQSLNSYASTYRITNIDVNSTGGVLLYHGVWVGDSYGWSYYLNYAWSDFSAKIQSEINSGKRPIDFKVYPGSTGPLYAGVFQQNTENYAWSWAMNYDWNGFLQLHNQHVAEGKRLIDYEIYTVNRQYYYSGIWVNDGRANSYALNYHSGSTDFYNQISTNTRSNLTPFKFNVFDATAITSVQTGNSSLVKEFALRDNYPNPFNPSTTISFQLPKSSMTSLKIFNTFGQEIATLIEGEKEAGSHQVQWNATTVASGVYFYRLQAGEFMETKKMILLK